MVNNFKQIRALLDFRSKDDFYFLQILQRKKDQKDKAIKVNGTNNNARLVKAYYISSLEYFDFIENGFDLVSSNKIANTLGFDYYRLIRDELAKKQKQYLYETNVGAGLPLIDTIKLLHLSGENITRIKGVFSGSLSYIFNTFSLSNHRITLLIE